MSQSRMGRRARRTAAYGSGLPDYWHGGIAVGIGG